MDFALSSARLNASAELMSGLVAPVRTITQRPERATSERVPAAILPSLTASLINGVVRMATSNPSPASIWRFNAPTTSNWTISWWPVSCSNRGPSSFITDLIAEAHRTFTSAASAATLWASKIMMPNIAATAVEAIFMVSLLLSFRQHPSPGWPSVLELSMYGHSLDAVLPKRQVLQFPLLWHRMKILSATGSSPLAGALLPCVRVSRLQYNLASLKASRKKWVTVIVFLDLCMSF